MDSLGVRLCIFDSIPDRLLDVRPGDLDSILPGPSLIRFAGAGNPPLFVSTLLHGNETTGFLAVQELLKKYGAEGRPLPRELLLFLGNVRATRKGLRRLAGQPDYNRIWGGGNSPEHGLAGDLLRLARDRGLFASIDIHNTSGRNPHYACVDRLDPPFLGLARLFGRLIVHALKPNESQSVAFSEICPAVTIESGRPGDPSGVRHVREYLETCMKLPEIPEPSGKNLDAEIYRSTVRIRVPENSRIGFGEDCGEVDFRFVEDLDLLNFSEVPEDTLLGWRLNPNLKLSVLDEKNREVGDRFLRYCGTEIRIKRFIIPSMLTTDENIARDDCLGYFMERYSP